MSKISSTVDINGQRYNAITGQLVGTMKKAATQVKKPSVGFNLDGFTKRSPQLKPRTKRSVSSIKRVPERSKTLMRSVVKKPSTKMQKTDSVKNHNLTPNYARAFRAKITPKNDKVRKFGLLSSKDRAQSAKDRTITAEIITRRAPQARTISSASASAQTTAVELTSHQQLERLLDYALHRADAHKQALKHSAKKPWHKVKGLPKWLSIAAVFFVFGGVGGFIVWKNVPAVPLKVAASRAQINASLPSYTPAGFNYAGHIEVKAGAITIPYTDSSKSYTVTQKASKMDSSSLADTALPKNVPTQTLDASGHAPVFGYTDNDNSVATCVSGGVQTIVSGNIDTDSAQKVASSLCR